VRTFHAATFPFGWSDIADAMRTFGELVRETPDEVRAGFFVDPDTGASARCGFYGDATGAGAYLARWIAAFPSVGPRMESSMPNPQGEVWATTALAVDGAFLEGMTGDVVEVLARAAVAARGVGAMLMRLSKGVASRVGMTDTAYPLRATGLSCLLSAEWKRPQGRERAERWVAEHGASVGAPRLRELPPAKLSGADSRGLRGELSSAGSRQGKVRPCESVPVEPEYSPCGPQPANGARIGTATRSTASLHPAAEAQDVRRTTSIYTTSR